MATVVAVSVALSLTTAQTPRQERNVILFVPDGLRALRVDNATAPALAALAREGVTFSNSHSLYPTLTMPNASALATGHYLGDTGVFANSMNFGYRTTPSSPPLTVNIENDDVLRDLDSRMSGNFIREATLLEAARRAGFSTAAIGKLGPTLLQDHTASQGDSTLIVDDSTGFAAGIPLAPEVARAVAAAGLAASAPARGNTGTGRASGAPPATAPPGNAGTWFIDIATKVVLPLFKERKQPFFMVFWSRDPDGSQHNNRDGIGGIEPGINGPTSLAGIRNADNSLRTLRDSLVALGLDASTNIVVSADHGFSTVAKESHTSPAARASYADVAPGTLPPGFLALDLADALGMPLTESGPGRARIQAGRYPVGSAFLGSDPSSPEVAVVPNGGSDLVYLSGDQREQLAQRIVAVLAAHDYVSGMFVDDGLGKIPGALPMSALNLSGQAIVQRPSIIVNFRSFSSGCAMPTVCGVIIADAALQQGQGHHGSFSRADTYNFMAAVGPDFRRGFVDLMPTSNADVGRTIAELLRLPLMPKGRLVGRVLSEALTEGRTRAFSAKTLQSAPASNGLRTVLKYQEVEGTRYFDAAGFPGRTLGLEP